jgi:hypothetical protein
MSELYIEDINSRKLARAYVALALAQDVAKRYVSEKPDHIALQPLLTILNITAELMEEILQNPPPEESFISPTSKSCPEMIM